LVSFPIDKEKKMNSNNSDGNFIKNSDPNMKILDKIKFDIMNRNNFNDQANTKKIRKFSENSYIRRSIETRSNSINKIKQNEKIKQEEKSQNFEIDKFIKIEFLKSFSVKKILIKLIFYFKFLFFILRN
jgi:hypothetical protein